MADMRRSLLKHIARSKSPNLVRYDKLLANQAELITFSDKIAKQNERITRVLFEEEISEQRREQLLTKLDDNEMKNHRINYLVEKGFEKKEQLQNLLQQEYQTPLLGNGNSGS